MQATVYTTPTCPYCTMTKRYLKEKGVSFAEVDVSVDQRAAQTLFEKTGQMGVPVTQAGDDFVVGYDPKGLDRLLGL
ncbi:MAG: glutaredoxin family protein [Christensenellales bacterium]|jgi:glutaredoxin 3